MSDRQETSGSGKRGLGHAAWGVGAVVVFFAVFGIFIRLLWNWLMPVIFGLPRITYPQAVGLLLLTRLLFGRMGQRRDHAGYLTGKYGFRRLIGTGGSESAERQDAN